jgi:hypothetical protein
LRVFPFFQHQINSPFILNINSSVLTRKGVSFRSARGLHVQGLLSSETRFRGPRKKAKVAVKASASRLMIPEMHRRRLGDAVKAHINVTKWCVEAKTTATADCDLQVFRALIVPNASLITPSSFDQETPVVVAQINGSGKIAKIFGKTKIAGGTCLGSWVTNEMDIIFYPSQNEITCWWKMR